MSKRVLAAFGALTLVATLCAFSPASAAKATNSAQLREAVTVDNILAHETALQSIADQNDGVRASGTPGYDDSADYVADQLLSAGYRVRVQRFDFRFFDEVSDPVFERTSPDQKTYVQGDDFATMTYSGSGDVNANLQEVNDNLFPPPAESGSTAGCEASDFDGFTAGNVALIQRGTCTFAQKAENAETAGASGVIIFNEGQEGRTETVAGTLGADSDIAIPVVGASFAVGQELHDLLATSAVSVHLFTDTLVEIRPTSNVIADTTTGRTDQTVVVGAHLDSVTEGPGINDNGSGSASILETALQMAKLGIEPRNRVRFAFWGAEEAGLVGSAHYVSQLTKRQIKDIALNLNFDMVGSPNFVRFVYDGDGSDTDVKGPPGSGKIEDAFVNYFTRQGLETDPTAQDGRSDYASFTAVGIPAGGLFTGAEGVKTPEQAAVYGGTAGEAYDHCYHQACDTLDNLNTTALDQMSDAIAHATLKFAMTRSDVGGTESRGAAKGSGERR